MLKAMFVKLSGRTQKKPETTADLPLDPAVEALLRAIDERRKADRLIGAKFGGREIFKRLLEGMKDDQGVHVESLLCALGSLAGYSCQAYLRALAAEKGLDETVALHTMEVTDGRKYFFGDLLNQPLVESKYSIWSLAAGAAQQNGCTKFPDIKSILAHVIDTLGTDAFGVPRYPGDRRAGDIPINYLKALWPVLFPVVKMFCKEPDEWPILFGIAIQEALDAGKNIVSQDNALQIVMEAAIPMSKVDLAAA